MSTNDTFLAVFLGSKTSAKMAAWNALPEAERRGKEQQGSRRGRHGSKSTRRRSSSWVARWARPRGSIRSGVADISNEMGAFTVVRAALPRGRRETVREPPAFCDLPRRARGDHASAPIPGGYDPGGWNRQERAPPARSS